MVEAFVGRLQSALLVLALFAATAPSAFAEPKLVTTIEGRITQAHPLDVEWRKPDGKTEKGNVRVLFGTRTLIYDTGVTEKVAERTCGNYCEDEEGHNGHANCDTDCDWPCESVHRVTMTPRLLPLTGFREGEMMPLSPLLGAGLSVRDQLGETFGITPQSIGDHFGQKAHAAENAAIANLLNIPADQVGKEGQSKPPTATLNIRHWVDVNDACALHTLVFGMKMLEVRIQCYAKVIGTFPSGPMEQEFSEEPLKSITVMMPSSQPIGDYGKRVDCMCYRRMGMDLRGPIYRVGEDFFPLPGSTKTPGIETGAFPGYRYAVNGIDMNKAQLTMSVPVGQTGSIRFPAGTRLIPNDPSVQVMSVLRDTELSLPPQSASYAGYLASLIPIAAEPQTISASVEIPIHCMEIQKKEPSPKTTFKIRANRDDALKDIFGFYEKSRHKGPWDQARTWIYTDNASLEEVNERISPEITRGQYVNALRDLSSVGALDLETAKVQKLLDPQHLLGTAATDDSTEWFIFNLSFYNPKGLINFLDKNANLFQAAFSGPAVENGVRHVSGIIYQLLNSPIPAVRQAGGRFAIAAVPPAARKAVLLSNGLNSLGNLTFSEDEESALQGLEVLIAYKPKVDTTILKALQANTESSKIKAKAAEAIAAIQTAP